MQLPITQTETKKLTGKDLLEMGDIGPCELIEGEIRLMSPTNVEHAYIETEISRLLGNFVATNELGWIMGGEMGIYTRRNPDTVRGADVAFISKQRLPKRPRQGFLEVAPDLVVEIVSPTDRWSDLHDKIDEYFAIGVSWVWVVEPRNRGMRVYHAPTQVRKLDEDDTLHGEGVLDGFELKIAGLFAE